LGWVSLNQVQTSTVNEKVEDRSTLVKRIFGKKRKSSSSASRSPTALQKHSSLPQGHLPHMSSFDRSSRGSYNYTMSDQGARRDHGPSPTQIGRVVSTNLSSSGESQRDVFIIPPPQPVDPPKRPIGEKIVRWLKYGPVD